MMFMHLVLGTSAIAMFVVSGMFMQEKKLKDSQWTFFIALVFEIASRL